MVLAMAAAGVLRMAPLAHGITDTWTDGTGNWNTAANWSANLVPTAGDDVNIVNSDGVARTITYNYTGPAISLNSLTVDLTGAGTNFDTVSMTANALTIGSTAVEIIGNNGRGSFSQTGGTHTINGSLFTGGLYLGYNSGSVGGYSLGGTGALLTNVPENIGWGGNGTFIQTAGTNSVQLTQSNTNGLTIGGLSGSSGTYSLSGTGSLSVNAYETIGSNAGGPGAFIQSGGTHSIGPSASTLDQIFLFIGQGAGATGSYSLSAGSLNVLAEEYIGYQGNGSFVQSGGTHTVGSNLENHDLFLGCIAGSTGSYSLSGTGALVVNGSEGVGGFPFDAATGSFTQSGGTHVVTQGLEISTDNNGANGNYLFSAGTLTPGSLDIHPGGTFHQTGGTLNCTQFNQNGGAATFDVAFNVENAKYTLSGGTLTQNNFEGHIGDNGSGTFVQTGGTHTVNQNLLLAVFGTSTGSYALSAGTLTVNGIEFVGYNSTAGATFTQTGGTHTVTDLVMANGSGDHAVFTLNNSNGPSTFTVNGYEVVGGTGSATFTQTSATHTISGNLMIGSQAGGNGTYSLSGTGVLTVGTDESVGDTNVGTFIQSGGSQTVTHSLLVGKSSGSTGVYSLSSGVLNVLSTGGGNVGEFVGESGAGTMNQSGGTNTVGSNFTIGDLSTGTGVYNLSGGLLSLPTTFMSIAADGHGTFTQTGGAVSIPSGSFNIAFNPGSVGVYTLNNAGATANVAIADVGGSTGAGGGAGVMNIQNGAFTSAGTLKVWNTSGTQVNLSGGTLTVGVLDVTANQSRFFNGWTGGTLGITGPGTSSFSTLPVGASGASTLAQSGGTVAASGLLSVSGNSAYLLSGGTLTYGSMSIASGGQLIISGNNSYPSPGGIATVSGAGAGNGVLYNSAATNTYSGAITLGANSTIGAAANSTLALTGGINKNGFNLTLSPAATGNINVNSVISGNADVIATGGGTVLLNVNNTYVGPTQVTGGATLSIGTDGRLGAVPTNVNSSAITLNSGTLQVTGTGVTINANRGFSIGSGGGTINITTNNTVNAFGPLSGPSNATMTKTGTGTWFMNGNSSNYFGKWIITGGEVNPGNLGTADQGWGAVPTVFTPDYFTLNNSNSGVTTGLRSGIGGSYQLNANRGITLGAGGGMLDAVNSATVMTISPVITGAGSLILPGTNTGTIVLSGSNTYTGTTEIRFGTLRVAPAGPWEVIPDVSDVLLTSNSTTFDLNGHTETIGSLAGNGLVTLGGGTLNAGASGASSNYSGVLSGTGLFTKTGAGNLTLASTSSSYTGTNLNVNGGTLTLANSNAIPGTVTVNVANGATFAYANSAITFAGPVNNAGTVASQAGATVQIPSGGTSSGTFTTAANSTIAFTGGTENLTNANPISGLGIVQVSNATVNTSSNLIVDNYLLSAQTGSTVSVAGNLGVGNNGTLTGGSGNGTVNVTGSLNVTHQAVLGSTVGGGGSLSVIQSGALSAAGLNWNDVTVSDSATVTITSQPAGGDDPEINSSLIGGYLRDGAMTVTGGSVTSPYMKLGITSGKTGTYNQSGGTVNLDILGIGNDTSIGTGQGTGHVTVSGGTMNVGTILMGSTQGSSADMAVSNSGHVFVGGGADVTSLTVTDGFFEVLDQAAPAGEDVELAQALVAGYQNNGSISVSGSGGTIISPKIKLGIAPGYTGMFSQSGGTVNITGDANGPGIFSAGNDANINSSANQSGIGHANISGGSFYADTVLLGSPNGGSGDFTVSGNASVTIGGGFKANALIMNGGSLMVMDQTPPVGEDAELNRSIVGGYVTDGGVTVNSGTVTSPKIKLGITSGKTGTFVQNGGTVNVTTLGVGNDANVTMGQGIGHATLSGGTLNATNLLIGSSAGGTGDVTWSGGQLNASNLTIAQNGSMAVTAGRNKTLVLSGLAISGNGVLDLSDNALVVNYAAGDTTHSVRDTIRNLLKNGRNGGAGAPGAWNGVGGITSSFAHSAGNGFNLAIGYGDNEDLASVRASGSYTAFGGQNVASNTVLVQMTRGADATLDGVVDSQDVTIIGTHFNKPGSGQWCFGDFDYSGTCDSTDVTTLGTTFGKTSPALSPAEMTAEFGSAFTNAFEAGQNAAVPEPASSVAAFGFIAGVVGLLRRRRRRIQMNRSV